MIVKAGVTYWGSVSNRDVERKVNLIEIRSSGTQYVNWTHKKKDGSDGKSSLVTAFYNAKEMLTRLLGLKEDKEHVETKVVNKVQDIRAQLGMDGERCASSQGETEVPMHSLPAEEAGNGIPEAVEQFVFVNRHITVSTALWLLKKGAQIKRANWTGYLQLYDYNGNVLPYNRSGHEGTPAEILYRAVDGSLQYPPWRSEDFLSNDWMASRV